MSANDIRWSNAAYNITGHYDATIGEHAYHLRQIRRDTWEVWRAPMARVSDFARFGDAADARAMIVVDVARSFAEAKGQAVDDYDNFVVKPVTT